MTISKKPTESAFWTAVGTDFEESIEQKKEKKK
jgi:hypothetical protein